MSHWQDRAACVGHDPDIFSEKIHAEQAARICAGCPVTVACREASFGMTIGTWAGVWRESKAGESMTRAYLEEHGTVGAFERHLRRKEKPCQRCVTAKTFAKRDEDAQRPQTRKKYTYQAGGKRVPA